MLGALSISSISWLGDNEAFIHTIRHGQRHPGTTASQPSLEYCVAARVASALSQGFSGASHVGCGEGSGRVLTLISIVGRIQEYILGLAVVMLKGKAKSRNLLRKAADWPSLGFGIGWRGGVLARGGGRAEPPLSSTGCCAAKWGASEPPPLRERQQRERERAEVTR